jgi:4-amino-4-deoxy-L-arabinose transferase-like glycosyltransferase
MKVKLSVICLTLLILLTGFFRVYNFEKQFSFAHDQDLYSWIAKDIIVNHHPRLVGQITSVAGVFIGSFYYYLMAVFYAILGMNPISAVIPLTAIALFNMGSIYWVVKRHFGRRSGLIAAFIYAISYGIAVFDRWSVPTLPTLAWSIWFLEVILELLKGNLKWLPLYGFLTAFTWQVHIALLPVTPLPIVAYLIGGNKLPKLWAKNNIKTVTVAILIFLITLSPFLLFELKHNFSQTRSMVTAEEEKMVGPTGKMKLLKVIDASGREFQQRLLFGNEMKPVFIYWLGFLLMFVWIIKCKRITYQQAIMLTLWYFLILLAQGTSKRIVSEYYFTNLVPMYVVVMAIFLSDIKENKILGLAALGYFLINFYWLVTRSDNNQSYYYRLQTVDFIKSEVAVNNYPCVAVNFIADPGVGVGFRYLFWYRGINLVKPGTPGVPVFNVSIPWQISAPEEATHFGRFGIVVPPREKVKESICGDPRYQLDPLLGYTE